MLKPKVQLKKGTPEFTKTKKLLEDMKRGLKKMPTIAVGLPKDSTPYPDGTSVVMVGFWNEFGSIDGAVPARPWLRTGAHNNKDKWINLARDICKRAIAKGKDPAEFMALLGQQMQADIQASIDSGSWEPNRGQYAAYKVAKGKEKPLIFTGHMRASVRYVVMGGDDDSKQSDSAA